MTEPTTPSTDTPPWVDPALLDAQNRVAVDRSCVKCGYNVRTLHASANCPECGYPVADAVCQSALRWSHRDWLAAVRNGASALCVIYALGATTALLNAYGAAAVRWSSLAFVRLSTGVESVNLVMALCAPFMCILGAASLATADTRYRSPEEDRQRLALRHWLLAAFMCALAAFVASTVYWTAVAVWLVAAVVYAFATLYQTPRYAGELLARADDRRGQRLAAFVAPTSVCVALVIGLLWTLTWGRPRLNNLVNVLALPPVGVLLGLHAFCYGRLWAQCRRILRAGRVPAPIRRSCDD